MTLTTERLVLRPFTQDDWRDLHEYLSQDDVVLYEPYGVYTEVQSRDEALRRACDPHFWAVCLAQTGKVIGNIYFAQQEPQEFSNWELGYVFNTRYQKNGYATEACRAVLGYGFDQCSVRRVCAMCNPLNTSSWRLLERLGFRREGHLIQNIYFKHDECGNPIWCDTYEYAMLQEQWAKTT